MSEEQFGRYGRPICGAQRSGRSSSGPGVCRNLAGHGTDHIGVGTCKFHGGNTPNHRTSAVTQEVARRMVAFGEPIEDDPHVALIKEVHRTSGHVAWLQLQVQDNPDPKSFNGRVWLQTYQREREHLVRVCKTAIDAGVAEREVRVAERQGEVLAEALVNVLNEMGLTHAQYWHARELIANQLRAITLAPIERSVVDAVEDFS